ncbi:MAG: hypothetical protein JWN69_1904 [Alphaproteobacteria bacterium]|nr:hypothetical protein [Alphaproteobacteria bacterium]
MQPRLAQMQRCKLDMAGGRFPLRGAVGYVEFGAGAGDMIVPVLAMPVFAMPVFMMPVFGMAVGLFDPHGRFRLLMQDRYGKDETGS